MRHGGPLRAVLLIFAFTILVRLPWISIPLTRDEGTYAYMALGLLRGEMPYRDTIQGKPPLLYLLMLPFALAGRSDTVFLRLSADAYQVIAVLLVWRLGCALMGPGAALAAALIFSLASSDPSVSGFLVAAEPLMVPFILGAALMLWRGIAENSPSRCALGGALAALAILVKQSALPLLGLAVLPWLAGFPRNRRWSPAAFYVAGSAAVLALAAAGLAAVSLLEPFAFAFTQEIRHTSAGIDPGETAIRFADLLARSSLTQGALWIAAGAGLLMTRLNRGPKSFLVLWLALAALGALLGRRAYPHYLLALIPPLSLLAGSGFMSLLTARRRCRLFPIVRAGAAAALIFSIIYLLPLAVSPRNSQSRHLFAENPFLEAELAAAWIRAHTPSEAAVFIAGSEPEIAVMARRRLAGRYPCIYPISGEVPGIREAHSRWIEEAFLDAPLAAVLCNNPTSWIDVPSSNALMQELRARVLKILSSPPWRHAVSIPPFEIYIRSVPAGLGIQF